MEYFLFPMKYLRVTQGSNTGSHLGSLAMDFGGKDTGSDKVYAPFSGVVKRERANANGEMYIWSDEKIKFADGTEDYATVTFIHDSTFNIPNGSHFKQGDYIYDEGGMGSGKPHKFATHLHMEVSRGHVTCAQYSNGKKWNGAYVYVTSGQVPINSAMWLPEDTIILNKGGYSWSTVPKKNKLYECTVRVSAGDKLKVEELAKNLGVVCSVKEV